MGRFAELHTTGLSKKTLKYKQGSVLNSEVVWWACALDSKQISRAQEGVCAALSVYFLADIMAAAPMAIRGPLVEVSAVEMTRFRRNQGVHSASNQADQKIAADVVPDQAKLASEWGKDWRQAIAGLAGRAGLKLNPLEVALGPEFLRGLAARLVKGVGYWIKYALDARGKPAAHAVALILLDDGIHFFDPNLGGYCITPANLDAFSAKYLELLASNFGWKYGSGIACLVNR